jgi:twitching motility protein PilT
MTSEQPVDTNTNPVAEPELNKFFRAAIKNQASDLHLKVGQPPKLRIHGQLKDTTGEAIAEEKLVEIIFEILTSEQKEFFIKTGNLDFAHEVGNEGRFRINIFRQRGMISFIARRVNTEIPSLESLHLPETVERIANGHQGLVLVVGPTGCGKTTTIAAMIDHINSNRSCHIVTIEDPIEYLFKDKRAIISQREVGIDVEDFDQALNYLMRQDPDVIFVGEMRTAKTVTAAIRAAETGRLVFGTMYSANPTQAVQRILDLFGQDERKLIRQTLSLTIRAIISQVLLPCVKEGIHRIPAVEILLTNPEAKKLIAEGRERDLPTVIRASKEEGMRDLTDNLCELVKNGSIEPKEAYKYAPNAEELRMAIKGIRATKQSII